MPRQRNGYTSGWNQNTDAASLQRFDEVSWGAGVVSEHVIVHRDSRSDAGAFGEVGGLLGREIADDVLGLAAGVPSVDGEQGDGGLPFAQGFGEAIMVEGVSGVVDAQTVDLDDVAEVAHESVGDLRSERVRVGSPDTVQCGPGLDNRSLQGEVFSRLHSGEVGGGDSAPLGESDDRLWDHHWKRGREVKPNTQALEVQVVGVLVGGEHEVDRGEFDHGDWAGKQAVGERVRYERVDGHAHRSEEHTSE